VRRPAIDVSVDQSIRFVTPSAGPADVVTGPVGSLSMASGVNTVGRAVVVPMTSGCAAAPGASQARSSTVGVVGALDLAKAHARPYLILSATASTAERYERLRRQLEPDMRKVATS
jgi:hypothetical protein